MGVMVKVLNLFLGVVRSFYIFFEGSFSKFVFIMMAEYTETKVGESSRTTAQTRISEIVSSKITNRKLDENNYL